MATKSIGYVVDLIGGAQVRSVDGVIRVLSIGDQINDGDILSTGFGAQIVLEFYNGQRFQVGENTEMLLPVPGHATVIHRTFHLTESA